MGLSVAKDELYYIYVLRVEENGWYVVAPEEPPESV